MRAGNGMLNGLLQILPFAEVCHMGIYKDKFTGNTVEYYFRVPKNPERKRIFLLDPLVATGSTVTAAIERLSQYGVGKIDLICLLAAPEGIARMRETFPEVQIHCVSVERDLNSEGFICPGIGDAGERLYGTL